MKNYESDKEYYKKESLKIFNKTALFFGSLIILITILWRILG